MIAPDDKPLEFEWPGAQEFTVRRLMGHFQALVHPNTGHRVRDLAHSSMQDFAGANLQVVDATSGEVVATGTTDADGHYEFYGLPPALYILRVKQKSASSTFDVDGNLFVQISPEAKSTEMPTLKLTMTDCGLMY